VVAFCTDVRYMRPASQRFLYTIVFIYEILIISYLATFLGTIIACADVPYKAVNQSIISSYRRVVDLDIKIENEVNMHAYAAS